MPGQVQEIVAEVAARLDTPLGIHCHNDAGVAVANTLLAVESGATHVQGTINGYGERCGNADLTAILPNLQLKLGHACLTEAQLASLTEVSHYVSSRANLSHDPHQPYVGHSAFAHKGGMHVHAINKAAKTYEHIDPVLVGMTFSGWVATVAGWYVSEIGRQPWLVQGVPTGDGELPEWIAP